MFSLYRHRKSVKSKISSHRRNKQSRSFELLEDRRLLANYNVTTTADIVDPSDGKLSLREAIDLANAHSGADVVILKALPQSYKITIAGGGEDNNQTGDFDITDDLAIKSAGSGTPTIGGNGLDRVFDLVSDDISFTLNHVIVTGGVAHGNGGGIAGEGNDDTISVINGASIKNNISTSPGGGKGGGIYNHDGNITITNSHIDNNSAAAGIQGQGGGIFIRDNSLGALYIKNSTVSGNSAYEQAGGISGPLGQTTIINSQINNNSSGDAGGGALAQNGPVTISGSTFSGNTTSGHGGALVLEDILLVTNTTFSNNSAASDGGAAWTDGGSMVFSGSTFQNNTSTGGAGGAISGASNVTATKTTFNHNTASGVGGAIDQEGTGDVTVSGSTFTQNSAGDTGGAINGNGGSQTISVTDSKFTFNSALNQGGAIAADGETVKILRSTFDHNTSVNDDGGAIDDGIIDATDSKFTYNTSKADGGAINSEDNNISLIRCLFSCNTATNGEGGAFNDGGPDSHISAFQCTIDGNTAGGNGGGFAAEGVYLDISRSTISNNRSGSEGGGIYIITSGLNSDSAGSDILNCTISGNGAAVAGGGFDFEGEADLTVIDDTIVFNASDHGGGIAQTDGAGTIHIGDTIVAKNIANTDPDAYNSQTPFDDLGHNLVFADPDNLFTGPDDIFNKDPKLGALANNGGPTKTHALLKGSPAINAADDAFAEFTDQRGVVRGPNSDIGAFEKK